jgi:GAF domain-containing protein
MLAGTNDTAALLEELQFTLGEGPCVDASARGRAVSVPDLTKDGLHRWHGFTAGALEAGVNAVFAVPLQVGGIRVGVLDLHRTEVGGLGTGGLFEALAFAEAATALLLHLQAKHSADTEMDMLLAGSSLRRAVVHQATGMVAVQLAVPLSEALILLRARSYSEERPIAELAGDVVARLVRFGRRGT